MLLLGGNSYCSISVGVRVNRRSVHLWQFSGDRAPPANHDIVFVAGFAHTPNIDGLVWFVAEVLPLIRNQVPDAKLYVVGANPSEAARALASEPVGVTGRVTEVEMRARYASARFALAPLRVGAGVKSKVVEALREGLPLVTTSIGAQGLPGIENIVSVADDASALAETAVRLMIDDDPWVQSSVSQVQYAREHFSLEVFRRSFLQAIRDMRSLPHPVTLNHSKTRGNAALAGAARRIDESEATP